MLLKEIKLIGFGKFENHTIELKEGLNLIYGENEKGKTTIHNFIDGMFYGFVKPYARRVSYLDEHSRYSPWNGNRYAGMLTFKYDERIYRIEREFTRGRESTVVLNESTGEDITSSLNREENHRILQPGFHFFGFNNTVFTNTISIKQLNSRTETTLANEVRDKLINVSTTLDDNLSIEQAIEELNKKIRDIGSTRAPTSPYAINNVKIENLENKRDGILLKKQGYDKLLEEAERIKISIIEEEKIEEELKNKLQKIEITEKKKLYDESLELSKAVEELERTIGTVEIYKDISMEEYKEAINLSKDSIGYKTELDKSKKSLGDIELKLKDLEDNYNEEPKENKSLTSDYQRYEELEEEKNKLILIREDNRLEFLRRDFESNRNKLRNYKMGITILSILSAIFLILSIARTWIFLGVLIPSISIILLFLKMSKDTKKVIEDIELNRNILGNQERERLDKINYMSKEQSEILGKYNLSSRLELKDLYDRNRNNIYRIREEKLKIEELKERQKELISEIELLEKNKKESLEKYKRILDKNHSKNLDEYDKALKNKALYENSIKEKNNKINLLNRLLGDKSLQDLEKILEKYDGDFLELQEIKTKENVLIEKDEKQKEISELKGSLREVETNIKVLNEEISQLVDLNEEIQYRKDLQEKQNRKIHSLKLAMDTIERISKDIHSQFAPEINEKVGRIIGEITDGRYFAVRIDEEFNMKVANPTTGEMINIEDLSGGTIDQLYFSLRFGIINSMVGDTMPLILDDCFIQYDDYRLRNMLVFLKEIAKERQILLFTCQNRERGILEEIGVQPNLITLT